MILRPHCFWEGVDTGEIVWGQSILGWVQTRVQNVFMLQFRSTSSFTVSQLSGLACSGNTTPTPPHIHGPWDKRVCSMNNCNHESMSTIWNYSKRWKGLVSPQLPITRRSLGARGKYSASRSPSSKFIAGCVMIRLRPDFRLVRLFEADFISDHGLLQDRPNTPPGRGAREAGFTGPWKKGRIENTSPLSYRACV